jgi:hypothetical protein
VGNWGPVLFQLLGPLVLAGLVFGVFRMRRFRPLTLAVGLGMALLLGNLRLGLNFALQAQITEAFDTPLSWQAWAWFIAWLAYVDAVSVAGAWAGWRSRRAPFSRQTVEGHAYSVAIDDAADLDEAIPVLARISERHPDELPLAHDALVRLAARDSELQTASFDEVAGRLTAGGISPETVAFVAGTLAQSAAPNADGGVA